MIDARLIVNRGFPPSEARALADHLLALPELGWDELRVSLRGCDASLQISAFFTEFFWRIDEKKPELLDQALKIRWEVDHDFQRAAIERYVGTYERRAGFPSRQANPDPEAFLAVVRELAPAHPHKALRVLFRELDALLLDGRFGLSDQILDLARPADLGILCAVGLAAVTLPARGHLRQRQGYTARLKLWLEQEEQDVSNLLRGLE